MFEKIEACGRDGLRCSIGPSSYTLLPEDGFRLMTWTVKTAKSPREVLYWPEKPDPGTPVAKLRGGNPILFPFAGRSYDRGLECHWRTPEDRRLPMPQHGFARDGRFEVVDCNDQVITGRLLPTEEDREIYPYKYRFEVEYRFEDLAFTCVFRLFNEDDKAIPWSAGHHFYFTLPWHPGARRNDYQLMLDSRKQAFQGPDGKLILHRDRESCHNLADPEILGRNHFELRHRTISFGPRGGEEDIHLRVGSEDPPSKGLSIVTWTEAEDSPFYCVEPWMGPPNAAEHGKGLHYVNPGDCGTFQVEVSLY